LALNQYQIALVSASPEPHQPFTSASGQKGDLPAFRLTLHTANAAAAKQIDA
jgi:hypothetical protein